MLKTYRGQSVINEEMDIKINFNRIGRNKTAWGGKMNTKTAYAILNLPKLLKKATRNNWGNPKPVHVKKYNAVGFINFKASCIIDQKKVTFRIPVMITKGGKFQYYINENVK